MACHLHSIKTQPSVTSERGPTGRGCFRSSRIDGSDPIRVCVVTAEPGSRSFSISRLLDAVFPDRALELHVAFEERVKDVRDKLGRLLTGAVLLGIEIRIAAKPRRKLGRQRDRQPDGNPIGKLRELDLLHFCLRACAST